jgi:hypothetical protein
MAWNTLQPSSEEDTLLPSSPCPIYPFDIAHNIDPPHFETTLPYTSHGDIPITIIGMSLTRHPSSDSPIMTPTGKSMADSGANVCVTHDLSLLTNIEDITPIPLGVAVSTSDHCTPLCTKRGYLPIPLQDGTWHHQPFLYNEHATDTILSPAHIMRSCSRFRAWTQSCNKDDDTKNDLTFMDDNGNSLLVLPLISHNGLQYYTHTR